MNIINISEYDARSKSARKKENTIHFNMMYLQWTEIEEQVAEIWMLEFMGTQYQNMFVVEYINVLIKQIERKEKN
jgi:hypothetical protein